MQVGCMICLYESDLAASVIVIRHQSMQSVTDQHVLFSIAGNIKLVGVLEKIKTREGFQNMTLHSENN